MQLEFKINEQTITHENPEKNVVANSVNYLTCKFTFSEDWNGIEKTVIFVSAKGEVLNMLLDESEICPVPWEVIEHPHFTVSVFGGDRITANKVSVTVTKSGYMQGGIPKPPTPDVYTQILNSVKTPYIGENGNWFIWDNESNAFVDSGQKSQGDIPEEEIKNYIDEQTEIIKSDIEGIQEDIKNEAHFRGYLSTNAKVQALVATPNDFAYSAESGTKWVYDAVDGWQDTGAPVPDQLTPASDDTPLMNGEASAGKSEKYARGDHRHPTDTTRASVKYVDDTLSIINGEEVKEGLVEEELGWTEGVIQTANGADGDNNTRARTLGYIKYDESVVLNVSNNAQVYVLFYTSKSTSGYIKAVGWHTGTINVKDFAPDGAKYFRLSGRYVTTSAPNGIALSGRISYVSNNVKLERYCERTVVATLKDLDSRINKVNNLFYKGIDFSEITEGDVVLDSNYVTCLYGDTEFETLNISFNTGRDANVPDLSQESVLILDLTYSSTTPTIVFNEDIKWINGEVPEITRGKVYMISFVLVRTYDDLFSYCLAVANEFE